MNKRTMLIAFAAVSTAMLVVPAFANAQSAHLDAVPGSAAVIHGGHMVLTRHNDSEFTTCTSVSGTVNFENTTTGTMNLVFHGCKNSIGLTCTTAGQPAGTIAANNLPFHLIMYATNKPGILITPNSASPETTPGKRLFMDYACFGVTAEVFGNGVIGTITSPACGASSTKATVNFAGANGTQEDMLYTGTKYDLESKIANGAHVTSALDTTATITFPASRQVICTHTT